MNLVIVESPKKAELISGFLKKHQLNDYKVMASAGHVRDLKQHSFSVNVEDHFRPEYVITEDKKSLVRELKAAAKKADLVYLASDEDREGEAIAWHLSEALELKPEKTRRIVCHEITAEAFLHALEHPREVNMNLVDAQQARRVLDRIVGFELSPVLWKRIRPSLSAGRVQSVAVRLIVDREREITAFVPQSSYRLQATFVLPSGERLLTELNHRFATEAEAEALMTRCATADFSIGAITRRAARRSPAAPFTTSTLQQEAAHKLGYSVSQTMRLAQSLYESGHITYMRTDSVNLSKQALADAKRFITDTYGETYSQTRTFKTKAASAQEAHEAIRPTSMALEVASSSSYDQKLYDLIRRRTLASQMAAAKLERTTITIHIEHAPDLHFTAKGEVILFDGFLKVYGGSKKDAPLLPSTVAGDTLELRSAAAKEVFSRPPARYTEGSLVKKLEELGIGRPSTYATILGTIQERGYAEKGEGEGEPRDSTLLRLEQGTVTRDVVTEKTGSTKGKLLPTPSGELIADFLTNHFTQIVDYDFTATVETEFDQIAARKLEKETMLRNFYTPFHARIAESGTIDRTAVAKTREIGVHPKTGKVILARFGRFGPMLQLGSSEDTDKPQFAPLPKGERIETVTLEQALHAFTLPRLVGQTEDGQDIKANIGRFGPYIQVGKLFVSIKPEDPHTISLKTARELYAAKLKAEAEKHIADFGDGIRVLKGRFGPYITDGTKNVKVPKDTEPQAITHEQAKELLAAAPEKKKRGTTRKKATTAKKPTRTRKVAAKK